jgi:hypothetical protein
MNVPVVTIEATALSRSVRTHPAPQDVTEPLDRPPLDDEQLYVRMDVWKDGFWKVPRQRSTPE